MAVQLDDNDFPQLINILAKLPDLANVWDRRRLLESTLEGTPRSEDLLRGIALEGTPLGASTGIVRFLQTFGQVASGKEALGVFLNRLQSYVGEEDASFIRSLFVKYPLDETVIPPLPIGDWRGDETPAAVQEKIIGENTLQHIRILQLALDAATAVVHLNVPRGVGALGTGFMIAPDLLMTNHHVISTSEEAETTAYTFNFQLDRSGKACEPLPAQGLPGGLFQTNKTLDYTIVQLRSVPAFGTPLRLRAQPLRKNDRVAIIQHPGGHYKQISFQNNFIMYADSRVIQYTTSTLPGSSGSPVFNAGFEVVAIHHSGGDLEEPGTGRFYLRNAGTTMQAILADLQEHAPVIYTHLGR